MGALKGLRDRLRRTPNMSLSQLIGEVHSYLSSSEALDVDSAVRVQGNLDIHGATSGISVTRTDDQKTKVSFGQDTQAHLQGATQITGDLAFAPQKTKLLNDQGDAVSFDDYLPQGGGSDVFFGAVAEDSDTGSKSISVTLESGETVAVTLFQIHPDDHLTAGTPLVVYKTTGGYRAQPATWLA
jgi:hypothetical protein